MDIIVGIICIGFGLYRMLTEGGPKHVA